MIGDFSDAFKTVFTRRGFSRGLGMRGNLLIPHSTQGGACWSQPGFEPGADLQWLSGQAQPFPCQPGLCHRQARAVREAPFPTGRHRMCRKCCFYDVPVLTWASLLPASVGTCLSSSQSVLFPSRTMATPSTPASCTQDMCCQRMPAPR